MTVPARGRAGGKVILLGEHSVVYGRPALVAGLGLGLDAEVRATDGPVRVESDRPGLVDDGRPLRLVEDAAAALGLEPRGFTVLLRSDLPAGAGVGSSAALAVAVVRALARAAGRALSTDDEIALGRRLETIFHGHASGIDPAAAVLGGCFRFVRGEPPAVMQVRPARPVPLLIALADRARSTGDAVIGLRARWERDRARHERLFDEVADAVEDGTRAVTRGDLAALGRAFDRNQDVLRELGVSTPEIEVLVDAARGAGALGAKLTGGGGGGAVVAVATEPERMAAAMRAREVQTIVVRIGGAEEVAA